MLLIRFNKDVFYKQIFLLLFIKHLNLNMQDQINLTEINETLFRTLLLKALQWTLNI